MSSLTATFIPSHSNKYRPHLIRYYGLIVIAALLLSVQTASNILQTGRVEVLGYATDITQNGLLTYTNRNRSASGLNKLIINSQLNQAAQAKAQHMVDNDYWAHIAPDGTTPWDFISGSGYSYSSAGENLAYGFITSQATVDGWMNSPSHRDNILTSAYQDVGFGVVNGIFQGSENTVVVAMYGAPQPQPASQTAGTPTAETGVTLETEPVTEPQSDPVTAQAQQANDSGKEQSDSLVKKQKLYVDPSTVPDPAPFKTSDNESTMTNLRALLSGQAGWALYATSTLVGIVALVYAYRHLIFVHRVVTQSEHFIVSHPLLEASILYLLLWYLLTAVYGSVL